MAITKIVNNVIGLISLFLWRYIILAAKKAHILMDGANQLVVVLKASQAYNSLATNQLRII
jgi:hypothetical protein